MTQEDGGLAKAGQSTDPDALFQSALAARAVGDLAMAARLIDAVLTLMPGARQALAARAQVALQRAEPDALGRFDAALRVDPGNPELHLGKARALEHAGDRRGARIVTHQIAQQAPSYTEAVAFLSSLYLATGEADFTAPFEAAAKRAPHDPNIPAAHCDALAGLDMNARAAHVAADARKRFANEPHFALLEARNAGAAGDWKRAEAIFADLSINTPDRWLSEARHRLRALDLPAAQNLLDRALAADPADIAAWALQYLVWRLATDIASKAKARWLHEQAGLVQMRPLLAPDGLVPRVRPLLDKLHTHSGMPLGQSLRGGSQTRGLLLERPEPALAELHAAITATLEAFRADLPPADPSHPLLSQRDHRWKIAGSWSVRLQSSQQQPGQQQPSQQGATEHREGGDYHTAHIHPSGIISSALYLTVPEIISGNAKQGESGQGWLELGRPPVDLGLDLPPVRTIRPQEGYLALFPSSLYHGTTAFGSGGADTPQQRLTVAFDVVPAAA
ncbi:MAG: putative 2OG-Fe(II) oxygenase [Erythrobacter sp.]